MLLVLVSCLVLDIVFAALCSGLLATKLCQGVYVFWCSCLLGCIYLVLWDIHTYCDRPWKPFTRLVMVARGSIRRGVQRFFRASLLRRGCCRRGSQIIMVGRVSRPDRAKKLTRRRRTKGQPKQPVEKRPSALKKKERSGGARPMWRHFLVVIQMDGSELTEPSL